MGEEHPICAELTVNTNTTGTLVLTVFTLVILYTVNMCVTMYLFVVS